MYLNLSYSINYVCINFFKSLTLDDIIYDKMFINDR